MSFICSYPLKFKREFHHAHCYVPKEIVYILQNRPNMIAPAIQAFYERDPLDLKVCFCLSFVFVY